MKEKFLKIWRDPVGSTVIATLLIGLITVIYNLLKAYYTDTNFITEFKKLWLIKIELWIILVVGIFIYFIIYFKKKRKKSIPFVYDLETLELDKNLFNKIRNELLTKETLDNLHTHIFSNHVFERNKLDFVHLIIKANEDPEFEFLNPELQLAKNDLIEALKKFQTSTFGTIFSHDEGYLSIPKEWNREKFYAAMDKIDPEETNVFQKAETLLKKGRRILKI